ncbi:MAG: RraA family protein [Rhodospirillaceae bacterium]|nr:RraA family protein [Rhodospirillaceae bacterium]
MSSHKVHATIPRPPAEVVGRFKQVMREVVTENVGRSQMMDPAIKPLNGRDWSIVGPAVTVKIDAFDHLMSIAALGVAQPGDVIVIAANGHLHSAVWGGGLTLSAKHVGVEAVVVDGAVMDSRAILAREVPVFCRGSHPSHGTWERPGSVNVPVACGGIIVNPGDLVFGDLDGVVVVRREDAETVLSACEEKTQRLRQVGAELTAAKSTMFARRGGKDLIRKAGVEWID